MNGLSGDAVHVHMEIIKLAAERRGPGALSAPKPMAGVIAQRVGWATHGSDQRLNKALQELRAHGKASYVKGTGWVPTGSEVGGDEAMEVEVTFSLTPSVARLLVKAYALDHDNHVIRRAAQGPVKETDPDLMAEAERCRDIVRMLCSVAEED